MGFWPPQLRTVRCPTTNSIEPTKAYHETSFGEIQHKPNSQPSMLLQINSVIKSDWVLVEYDQGVRASQVAETVKRASEPSRNLLERTPSISPSVHRKNTPKRSPEHSPSSLHSSAYLVKARTAFSSQPSRIPRPSRAPSAGSRDARLSSTMQTSPSSDTSNALREEPQVSTHDAKVWTEDEIHHLHNVSKQNVAGLRRTMRSSRRKTAAKIREFEKSVSTWPLQSPDRET